MPTHPSCAPSPGHPFSVRVPARGERIAIGALTLLLLGALVPMGPSMPLTDRSAIALPCAGNAALAGSSVFAGCDASTAGFWPGVLPSGPADPILLADAG